jgi:CRP-like cAMP-binding protein
MEVKVSEARRLNDIDLLARLQSLSWLSTSQRRRLSAAMAARDIARDQVIFIENGQSLPDVYILLSGAARLSRMGGALTRTSIAMIAPGVIFKLPFIPDHIGSHFRCEALRPSRIGRIRQETFIEIVLGAQAGQFSDVARSLFGGVGNLLTRYPSFLGFALRERVALVLLELGANFGISEGRGILLTIKATHRTSPSL